MTRDVDKKNLGCSRNKNEFTRRQALLSAASGIALASTAPVLQASSSGNSPSKRWDQEYDVVVVGLGVAGGAAAYTAAASGAKVLAIDRGEANASHGSNVYLGGGTPLQKAFGVDDSPDEMENYLLATQAPNPDREKIRIYVERSLEHYHWLTELGVDFCMNPDLECLIYSGGEDKYPGNEMAKPAMRGHRHSAGASGRWIQENLLKRGKDSGVTVWLDSDAERIIRGEDGVVEGVIVKTGRENAIRHRIRATSGVIIATGGFANNRDMIAHHAPLYTKAHPLDVGSNDGWGLRAGLAIGSGVSRLGAVCSFATLGSPRSRAEGIIVNSTGQRFVTEEDVPQQYRLGDRIVRGQDGMAYLIVDSKIPIDHQPPGPVIGSSPTIKGLESQLGLPEDALENTLALYNKHASSGKDPLFKKSIEYLRALESPPFSAVRLSLEDSNFFYFTLGGLRTNGNTEVFDTEDNVIPGFYAVGRVASGILNYPFYLSGLSLGESTLFGRIAGKMAIENRG